MPSSLNIMSAQLAPVDLPRRHWQRYLSLGVSLALLATIAVHLANFGSVRMMEIIPHAPLFWFGLAAYYLALPLSEWIIFHRLWNLPAEGFLALLRKLVSNEVLVGYSGELSFYAWARRHGGLTNAPFGAVKDVSITSAFAGNLVTLAMMGIAWPYLHAVPLGLDHRSLLASIGVVLMVSIAVGLFNRKLFSLPMREIGFMLLIHFGRLAATTILSAVIWHAAMPQVPLTLWIVLAALQLLVTRLPLVPNKDLVFANVTMLVVGSQSEIGALIALIATLILLTHLVLGGVLALADLVEQRDAIA